MAKDFDFVTNMLTMPGSSEDEKFMQRCLDLAIQGIGMVAPNPMVGSVLVHDKSIIGEGFHQSFGQAHAESNAIRHVVRQELLQKACLYVNLEPCCHQGKTPPCANLIIEKKIPRVVIGTTDPNQLVAGKGIRLLKENGVNLTLGVLEKESKALNKRFFTWHLLKRPYIILKWARSADGFIDFERAANAPIGPNWITSQPARTLVHKWRAEEQSILVGTNTVLKDNPRLNIRDWTGNDPLRVIIDRRLMLGSHHHVFDNTQESLVFTEKDGTDTGKTRYAKIIFDDTAELQMLDILYRENIQSLIIEGGAFTLNRFLEKGLWDEARIFTGPSLFKSGVRSPEATGQSGLRKMIGDSMLQIIYK
jgi:diaminohydroxyphosphoribosylaminopyrimidine deaminase / 5-amino-6-(5-phosphoribosylamino)uracil reductase